jgi:TetR/AcrR family transcriptional regulator, lmrAB and yxaGH operons repressor
VAADDSRTRMVQSAAALFGVRGANATSFSEVLEHSGAPRGSIYHHFPHGKRQLTSDAVTLTAQRVLDHQAALTEPGAAAVLERFVGMWRQVVVASDATAGCAIAGVTVDTDAGDGASMALVRDAFRAWTDLLAQQLTAAGIDPLRAASLAVTALAMMEGALILCRAERSVRPLDAAASELMRLIP